MPAALVSFKKFNASRSGSFASDVSLSESWTAVVSVGNATPLEVRSLVAASLPTSYPGEATARLASFDVEQTEARPVWRIKARYSTNPAEASDPEPWTLPPVLKWDFEEYEKTVTRDVEGKPLVNTLGDPYADITRPARRISLAMSWNTLSWSPALAREYCDVVNSTPFFGAGPREVLCSGVPADEATTVLGVTYYQASAKFLFAEDEENWKRKIISTGFYRRGPDGPGGEVTKRRIVDEDGEPSEAPGFLDVDGNYVSNPDNAAIQEFDLFALKSFNVFPRTS